MKKIVSILITCFSVISTYFSVALVANKFLSKNNAISNNICGLLEGDSSVVYKTKSKLDTTELLWKNSFNFGYQIGCVYQARGSYAVCSSDLNSYTVEYNGIVLNDVNNAISTANSSYIYHNKYSGEYFDFQTVTNSSDENYWKDHNTKEFCYLSEQIAEKLVEEKKYESLVGKTISILKNGVKKTQFSIAGVLENNRYFSNIYGSYLLTSEEGIAYNFNNVSLDLLFTKRDKQGIEFQLKLLDTLAFKDGDVEKIISNGNVSILASDCYRLNVNTIILIVFLIVALASIVLLFLGLYDFTSYITCYVIVILLSQIFGISIFGWIHLEFEHLAIFGFTFSVLLLTTLLKKLQSMLRKNQCKKIGEKNIEINI